MYAKKSYYEDLFVFTFIWRVECYCHYKIIFLETKMENGVLLENTKYVKYMSEYNGVLEIILET